MRVLSGMQSSGNPHLGNYFGAIQHHIELQDKYDCFYFIADYHALTTVRDPLKLKENNIELAIDYLALGINPEKTAFFRQSDVPEHTELCWIFNCITKTAILDRCHAWKEAVSGKRKEMSVGLYDYPVLMSADILIYKPDIVPVGKDQKQHVEISRDIAITFNHLYGEIFPQPEPLINEKTAVVPGTDGAKMSKSYGNVIDIFADEEKLKQQVMRIITDSTPLETPKNPETCTVFQLYSLFVKENELNNLKDKYLAGGFGYGEAKKLLFSAIKNYFQPFQEKKFELQKKVKYVNEVLNDGAKKAKKIAQQTLKEVRMAIGLS